MYKLTLAALAAGTLAVAYASGVGAQEQNIKIAIDKFSCRDMLTMSSEGRDFAIIFMHGFMSGKKADMVFDAAALEKATDGVINYCIDNANATLLSAFEKYR